MKQKAKSTPKKQERPSDQPKKRRGGIAVKTAIKAGATSYVTSG